MFDRSRVGPGRHQEVATWLGLEENANEVVFIKLDSSLNDEVRGLQGALRLARLWWMRLLAE